MPGKIKTFSDIISISHNTRGINISFVLAFDEFKNQPITQYKEFFKCMLVNMLQDENLPCSTEEEILSSIGKYICSGTVLLYEYSNLDIRLGNNDFHYLSRELATRVRNRVGTLGIDASDIDNIKTLSIKGIRQTIKDNL